MARVTVEDCLERVVDQFALVHLASARYRQLHRGAIRLVDNKNKNIVCALREIASDKVRFREDVNDTLRKSEAKLTSAHIQSRLDTNEKGAAAIQTEASENATPLI